MRKSESEPAEDRARIAVVGGERPSHCVTAAPHTEVKQLLYRELQRKRHRNGITAQQHVGTPLDLCINVMMLTAHWLSAVTVEGGDWTSVPQEVSNTMRAPTAKVWSSVGIKGREKWEFPETTGRPAASSGTIPICKNPARSSLERYHLVNDAKGCFAEVLESAAPEHPLASVFGWQLSGDSQAQETAWWITATRMLGWFLPTGYDRFLPRFCLSEQLAPSVLNSLLTRSQALLNAVHDKNRIRLERASQKQFSDTHKTPYDGAKPCRERKKFIKASEHVNVDVFTQNKRLWPQHSQTQFFNALNGGSYRRASSEQSCVKFTAPRFSRRPPGETRPISTAGGYSDLIRGEVGTTLHPLPSHSPPRPRSVRCPLSAARQVASPLCRRPTMAVSNTWNGGSHLVGPQLANDKNVKGEKPERLYPDTDWEGWGGVVRCRVSCLPRITHWCRWRRRRPIDRSPGRQGHVASRHVVLAAPGKFPGSLRGAVVSRRATLGRSRGFPVRLWGARPAPHVLDDSAPITDLQGNKKRIPYCQMCGNTAEIANEETSGVRLYKGLWSLAYGLVRRNIQTSQRTCLKALRVVLASHLVEPGSISVGIAHSYCFPRPLIPMLLHPHLIPPSSADKTSMLRAAQISSLKLFT
ncbi:hypothetical protein PR048_014457 [Dryococelus australis]|uniref:Uncharacterized protein n=1 Tax=Dryococelus australis TaxID=614101 RepID=A0ABQ9HE85_9NEOP|nr:hypothetical protein PR048_014457 [Dryococelus australis]